ncbi:hypothetical protein TGPRC2_218350 [Toxoplasma gondii TgCatPRC2]|uniref:Uncharacterized protein n=1 Tax=Toxoplasma gondii TgCatPRC2 TaxID=1130821 RepID=A0A151HCK5_TOXGO|nr:hypothetical protein TGPRC2_218350 [Toxoplasma gondii TgCatPRC2]
MPKMSCRWRPTHPAHGDAIKGSGVRGRRPSSLNGNTTPKERPHQELEMDSKARRWSSGDKTKVCRRDRERKTHGAPTLEARQAEGPEPTVGDRGTIAFAVSTKNVILGNLYVYCQPSKATENTSNTFSAHRGSRPSKKPAHACDVCCYRVNPWCLILQPSEPGHMHPPSMQQSTQSQRCAAEQLPVNQPTTRKCVRC